LSFFGPRGPFFFECRAFEAAAFVLRGPCSRENGRFRRLSPSRTPGQLPVLNPVPVCKSSVCATPRGFYKAGVCICALVGDGYAAFIRNIRYRKRLRLRYQPGPGPRESLGATPSVDNSAPVLSCVEHPGGAGSGMRAAGRASAILTRRWRAAVLPPPPPSNCDLVALYFFLLL
jgi:hypothetical protein